MIHSGHNLGALAAESNRRRDCPAYYRGSRWVRLANESADCSSSPPLLAFDIGGHEPWVQMFLIVRERDFGG